MSVTSARRIIVEFTSDYEASNSFAAASNTASPGQRDIVTLSAGNNTITKPTGGSTISALTIVPPSGNTSVITLKGVNGDTGVTLHLTDPSSIALPSTFASLVLNVVTDVVGAVLIWS